MLRQEINLYSHFKTQRTDADWITWKRFWMLNAIVASLMVLIGIISFIDNIYLRKTEKDLQAQLIAHQAKFEKIKGGFPQLFFDKDINEAVKSMKAQVAAQQSIITILSKHMPFSEDLMALSRTIVPNVWLNAINIEKNGEQIILKGDGIGINNVNAFINNLGNDKVFDNYKIEVNEVNNKDINDPNLKLDFEIKMAKKSA